MPVPDFSPGEVLTAAAMDSIGLWLVKSQTVGTGVSSVTVTDAFSATYDNYRIIYSGGVSSVGDTTVNFRHETILSTYFGVGPFYSWAFSGGVLQKNGTNEGIPVGLTSTNNTNVAFDVLRPFAAQFTRTSTQTSVGDTYSAIYSGVMKTATSYSQFILSPISGTFTGGTIRVYGYRN